MDLQQYEHIPHGDMPGDIICISGEHIEKARLILPVLDREINVMKEAGRKKLVVGVCGGSGVGKSEIASLLSYMESSNGRKSYVMSGDNYPHRIPSHNDAMREKVYADGGESELAAYLGSQMEIDFTLVNEIIKCFKRGDAVIKLKRMGRSERELWYEDTDLSDVEILFLEWTHANSDLLFGVDIPILLDSTPEETLVHRRDRNRDTEPDSPFVTMVLRIEQEMLKRQAHKAKIIVSKSGELIRPAKREKPMEVIENG